MKVLAAKVKHFLDNHRVSYRILNHTRTTSLAKAASMLQIDPSQVIKAVLLQNNTRGHVLAVLPMTHQIDLEALSRQMKRTFEIVSDIESDKCFKDCEPGIHPPFGEAYGISIILDKSIEKLTKVYLEVGSQTALMQLSIDDFEFLTKGAPFLSFATLSCPCSHDTEILSESEHATQDA